MPLDRDIDAGYTGSWASQHPQRTNRLIADADRSVDRKVESGALTPGEGRQQRAFNTKLYNKISGYGSEKIWDVIDRGRGDFIDRRPSGLANLFARMFGGGGRDQEGMSFNIPEAKEVVGPRQYGDPITGTTTQDALNYMASQIFDYGEDALLPEWAEQSTAMDKFGEARKGLYDDQGWLKGTTDEFYTDLNRAKMDAVKQLVGEYTQSGEFDYPDPGMAYGYDDYMGSREMFPGYELGQGLDIGSLRPIQPLGYKDLWD